MSLDLSSQIFQVLNSSRTGEIIGIGFEESKDVKEEYASSYISGVLGFGSKIALSDLPIGLLLGIRLQYSFGDLMGV